MNENILFVIFYDAVGKNFSISVLLFLVLVILYSLLVEKSMSLIRFVCECDCLYIQLVTNLKSFIKETRGLQEEIV